MNNPASVEQLARTLGEHISIARRRRRLTQQELAAKAGITRVTLGKLEHGHAGTSVGAFLSVLWALGLEQGVAALASPESDREGLTLEAARLGERVRPAASLDDDF